MKKSHDKTEYYDIFRESINEKHCRSAHWIPIKEAPKDGSWILLCGGSVDTLNWEGPKQPFCVVGQWTDRMMESCWQFAWYDGGYYGTYSNPTHWMPLPEPPE